MTIYSDTTRQSLKSAFRDHNMQLSFRSDHIIVENSQQTTSKKISQIIKSAKFCPLISDTTLEGNFMFTITPFPLPDFFEAPRPSPLKSTLRFPEQMSICSNKMTLKTTNLNFLNKQNCNNPDNYFSLKTISDKIAHSLCKQNQGKADVTIYQTSMIKQRSYVNSALEEGLFQILSAYASPRLPLIEISADVGYKLPKPFISNTVRLQSDAKTCQYLSNEMKQPAHKMGIKDFCDIFDEGNKKIPLFIGLNAFDHLNIPERQEALKNISRVQSSGDRTLILLDLNPCFDTMINKLKNSNIGFTPMPIYPQTKDCQQLSCVLVPEILTHTIPGIKLHQQACDEARNNMMGMFSEQQALLHRVKDECGLQVIGLEDFFIDGIKNDLKDAGYDTAVFYHAAFTTDYLPGDLRVSEDIIYKSVSDTEPTRQWAADDPRLHHWLSKKGLKLPTIINSDFIHKLRKNGQKILGAEFLVIEATKK